MDFSASWCAPCRALGPVVDKVAEEFAGRARVAKVEVDENPRLTARYGVQSIPTLLFFRGGEVVDRLTGAVSRGELESRLEEQLDGD